MDFSFSAKAQEYIVRLKAFMAEHVNTAEAEYHRQVKACGSNWVEPPVMTALKAKAKAAGLWNLFLPDEEYGAGLTNSEYAPLAEIMGWSSIAPEVFNCGAPDTGNMEVLVKYGSHEQKQKWLKPLLDGAIRSAFCMTEPEVASSDATNMRATAFIEGDEVVINGRKWWSSGIGHPHCRFVIFMGLTFPDAAKHARHSQVIVPLHTPGLKIERMLPVFGDLHAPFGHGEVTFTNVRVPLSNIIAGPGRGFEIAQGRLGPGRIHHCMRVIGSAERALHLLCERSLSRTAFGNKLAHLGGNYDIIANARMGIEQARLLTLKAAWLMDTVGVKGAMSEISQIKVVAPNLAQMVIDQAIQMHGGAGVSEDFPLTAMFANARLLRLADGPDEVHRALIAKLELKAHAGRMGVSPEGRETFTKSVIDQPSSVRAGEELDVAKVDAFLKRKDASLIGQPQVGQFRGGASNLTYQLTYPNRMLILRRPPFGHRTGSAHDMLREARVMTALKPVYPYVPRVLATSEAGEVLDCPFYIMERQSGIILRRDLPKEVTLNEADTRKLCINVIDKLIDLHQVDYRAASLEHLGKGDGYVKRQVDGWCERYHKARTEDANDFAKVMAWLKDKMPARDLTTCVIHNDYRFDNVVIDPRNMLDVVGVLDWEMATLGDPLMDLANTLAYWIEANDDPAYQAFRRQPTHLPGMLTRREVIDYYSKKTGYPVDNIDFHLIFGLFRLAGIVQQIYYRYRQGHAKNPEFATFVGFTNFLEKRCLDMIERSAVRS
ncbi:MAG TPA: phosphotransferase [Gemmatales bacterium]|nr:phosphotransferase [Gemmatales bacterium]